MLPATGATLVFSRVPTGAGNVRVIVGHRSGHVLTLAVQSTVGVTLAKRLVFRRDVPVMLRALEAASTSRGRYVAGALESRGGAHFPVVASCNVIRIGDRPYVVEEHEFAGLADGLAWLSRFDLREAIINE